MQFLFPALAAGFLFVAVPPLVHLINMLRHRRQQWAAMEFLLASYRKQKKWIILRQLLLLLCRIAIAVVMIAMLAGWTGGSGWLDALGGKTTHHVVVLDDSFSMSDTSGGVRAYDRALAALDGLSRRLATADGSHQLTVIRSVLGLIRIRTTTLSRLPRASFQLKIRHRQLGFGVLFDGVTLSMRNHEPPHSHGKQAACEYPSRPIGKSSAVPVDHWLARVSLT